MEKSCFAGERKSIFDMRLIIGTTPDATFEAMVRQGFSIPQLSAAAYSVKPLVGARLEIPVDTTREKLTLVQTRSPFDDALSNFEKDNPTEKRQAA